jgi:rod shape-determining protein MreD
VLVVGIALAGGVTAGMAAGFGAGLLADLLSAHPAGVLALCFALVGFLVGLLDTSSERSLFWPVAVTAVAAGGSYLVYAAIMSLLNAGVGGFGLGLLPTTVLYDVMLTPFVVPVVAALARLLDPEVRR